MQRTISRFGAALLVLYFFGVFVLSLQPLHTMLSAGYQGVVYKGGDESQYIMRVREAMDHPWSDVSNSIIRGDDAPRGLQMTFLEMMAGSLFSGTDLSAPMVAILLSVLLAPLVMPFLGLLAVRLGVEKKHALAAALLYFILLLGPLRRVVHQAWSLPFVFATLIVLADWWKEPTRGRTILLGILLGLVPGIYFWSWTFLWATTALTVILAVSTRLRHGERAIARTLVWHTVAAALITLAVASPFLILMWLNASHPESANATLRSSLIHAREFESVTRSVLYLLFAVASIAAFLRLGDRRRTLPLVAAILGLGAVLHQQFVHGLVLSFWTHYYPYVCAVAVLTAAVILSSGGRRVLTDLVAAGLGCLFLIGAFSDYKGRLLVHQAIPRTAQYQHLLRPLELLRTDGEKQTVLSDIDASLIVGTYTDDDIVFSQYLRHTLVSFQEFAERYCLTEMVKRTPADTEWLARDTEEKSAAGTEQTKLALERHVILTEQACAWVASHPKDALKKYGVTRLLWDERNHPDWNVSAKLFSPIEKGAGWSLWSVR